MFEKWLSDGLGIWCIWWYVRCAIPRWVLCGHTMDLKCILAGSSAGLSFYSCKFCWKSLWMDAKNATLSIVSVRAADAFALGAQLHRVLSTT